MERRKDYRAVPKLPGTEKTLEAKALGAPNPMHNGPSSPHSLPSFLHIWIDDSKSLPKVRE